MRLSTGSDFRKNMILAKKILFRIKHRLSIAEQFFAGFRSEKWAFANAFLARQAIQDI